MPGPRHAARRIAIVGAPSAAGARRTGLDEAPAAIRSAGLVDALRAAGVEVADFGDVARVPHRPDPEHPREQNAELVARVARDVQARVASALADGRFPVVLGGDCTVTIGVLGALRRARGDVALLWADGDLDLNTPETTPSGVFDGMVTAHLLGRGSRTVSMAVGEAPLVDESRLVYFGYDAAGGGIDAPELAALESSDSPRFPAESLAADPSKGAREALRLLEARARRFLLHFDVDVADLAVSDFPHERGLPFEKVVEALTIFLGSPACAGLVVTEYNPELDPGQTVARRLSEGIAGAVAATSGRAHARPDGSEPLVMPIAQTANYATRDAARLADDYRGGSPFVYLRFGNPTTREVAAKIAKLEGAEAALLFGSGMAAISTTLLALAGTRGAHVVAQREIFAQTFTVLDTVLRGLGVETTYLRASELDSLDEAIRPETRLVYVESPSNPLLHVVDLARVCDTARTRRVPVVVDGTFASPVLQNPLAHGASLVVHSATKFLNGHSDMMGGVVAGDARLVERIGEMQILFGGILDPHAAWLLARSLKTLHLRVERQSENALAIATFLARDPRVKNVHYPFLPSSPSYAIATKQMRAGGGMVSYDLRAGLAAARRMIDSLRLIRIATSLGGTDSIVEIPGDLDFGEHDLGDAASETGIPAGLVRLSVGVEDESELLEDVAQALDAACGRANDAVSPNGGDGVREAVPEDDRAEAKPAEGRLA
jgi:cystathionine gamma-synthase